MTKPVICHLSDFAPEYPGSFVDGLLCLAQHCSREFQVETLCIFPVQARGRKWLTRFEEEGVHCAFVPQGRNVVAPLKHILRKYEPIAFHSHFELFDMSAMFLKLLMYGDAKVVWHLHSLASKSSGQRLKDVIKVQTLGRYLGDLFVAVGDGAYRNAIERGFPPKKLILNRNGIDLSRFTPNAERRAESRAALEVASDQFVFLALGYDPMTKGTDVFIKAAAQIERTRPGQGIFIVVGRQNTKDFIQAMPEAGQLGHALRVIAPTDDFPRLLDAVDVLVSPSRSEALGYAVVEAMASGKLVVCSDLDGVRENFGQAEGVWLFPSEDFLKLSQEMSAAMELHAGEQQRFGEINTAYVTQHYSLEQWASRMVRAYSDLFGTHARVAA